MNAIWEFIINFFAGYSAQQMTIGAIGAIIAFFPSVNILQWLKSKTGWADSKMHAAVATFFGILAAIIMVAIGEIDPAGIEWTFDQFIAYWGAFALIGEAAYQRLVTRNAN